MTLDHFNDTRALSDAELHTLLAGDDARSRIFAIWALALRSMQARTLAEQLVGEPDPGVRRALAVVLAGEGEIDLLVALSRHDPNEHVRASAAQIVVRFAKSGQVPWTVIAEQLGDCAAVRAAVLGQIDRSAPAELHRRVLECLDHDDTSVRREAFETAVKLYEDDLLEGAALRRFLDRVDKDEATIALALWFAAGSPKRIAHVLAGASMLVRELALRARPDLAFSDLVSLIVDDPELFQRLQYEYRLEIQQAPLSLVLRVAAKATWCGDYVHEASERLASCASAPELQELLVGLRSSVDAHLALIEEALASPERLVEYEDETGEGLEELTMTRAQLQVLRGRVGRLTSH